MDFFEIEAFLALSESLHFARAATKINLSPSALSRLIFRLEEDMGVILVDRNTRTVKLTEEGETFLEFARETILLRDNMRLRIGKHDERLRGVLRIYASVTACYSILPPFVEALKSEHPEVRLSIETGDPADAAEAIRDGRVELALGALPLGGFPDLHSYSVRKTPLVFISSSSGEYGNLDLPPNDDTKLELILSTVPLILPKSGLARDRFNKWIQIRNIKAHIVAETEGNEAILALCRLGLGLGLVPRLVLENGPFAEGLALYHAGCDFGDYDIGFVQKSSTTGTDTAQRFRQTLTELIQRTYPE